MKTSSLCNLLILAFLAVASCQTSDNLDGNLDDKNDTDSIYKFGYAIYVHTDGIGSSSENIKDVKAEALSDNDKILSEITTNEHGSKILNVEIEPFDTDGISKHSHVLKWEYGGITVTDTVLCEFEKNENTIAVKKIWVNNHLRWVSMTSDDAPRFRLTKITPEHISLRDENSTASRIEKDINGLKFVYWLSDADGNEMNAFDKNDVDERGFNFNLSVTNNTGEKISFKNTALRFHGNIFETARNEAVYSCQVYHGILFTYEVMPGETHYEKRWWCTSEYTPSWSLSSGKYCAYFYNENFNVNIPAMFINFEIK